MENLIISIYKDTVTGKNLIDVIEVKMLLVTLKSRIKHGLFVEKAKEMKGIDFEELENIQKIAIEKIDDLIMKIEECLK